MVLDVCRSVLGNEADVEDAFQATFLVLACKAGSIRKMTSLGSWLHGVANRTALKARAQSVTRQKHEARVPVRETFEPDDLSWREVQLVLHEELNKLSERYRVPLVLCYLEGKTQEQAAEELGLAKSTLRERVERGRDVLRVRLVQRGLGPIALLAAAAWPTASTAAGVPLSLVNSTIKAASLFAASPAAAAGAISANATMLTEGVLKTMLLSKIKTAMALALLLLTCVGSAFALLPRLAAGDEPAKKAEATESPTKARTAAPPQKATFPDLTKIDRTIAKEPRYGNQPYYALLVFGPEAKKRVWLVVDGETLYVDRNGNGDLTEANKRIQKTKKIAVSPGMYKWMDSFDLGEVEGLRLRLDFWVRDKDFVPDWDFDKKIQKDHQENGWEFSTLFRVDAAGNNVWGQIPVTFCQRPQDGQICHLAGPLKFFLTSGDNQLLVRSAADNTLGVTIGTPGLPPRKHSDPVFAPVATSEVPADVHPVANFEFPHKDPKQPPIELEVVLKERWGPNFSGAVRVPADAGTGKARVTTSFPAWAEGKVAPTTFEVPIVEKAPPAEKTPISGIRRPTWVGKPGPDRLLLGTVPIGATVEASFILYEKTDDPKNVALTVEAPPFIKVLDRSVIEKDVFDGQNGWVKGVGGVVVIGIDTSKAGTFEGEVKVKLGTAAAKVPVSVVVKPSEPNAARMLVAGSPFVAYTTDDGRHFKDWTDLVAEAKWDVSYLNVTRGKPVFRDLDLSKYDVVLLSPEGLLEGNADDVKRVRAFVERGGRLVVAANRFLVGSVDAANKVLEGYGLKMLNEEAPIKQNEAILDKKAFGPEIIKAGIGSVRFHRASPVSVTDAKLARVLVKATGVGGPEDGFVAVANAGKGEVIVLGESLWWSWMSAEQARGTDNAKLLRLLLTPSEEKLKSKKD